MHLKLYSIILLHLEIVTLASSIVIFSRIQDEAIRNGGNLVPKSQTTHRRGEWVHIYNPYLGLDMPGSGYHKIRKNLHWRKTYPEGHSDRIIFPPDHEPLPLQLHQPYPGMDKGAYESISDEHFNKEKNHVTKNQDSESWPFSISNEVILSILKDANKDRPPYETDSRLFDSGPVPVVEQANRYSDNLTFKDKDENTSSNRYINNYWGPQNENYSVEDYDDIRYNSIILLHSRSPPACPLGYRRTHKGICRKVYAIRG